MGVDPTSDSLSCPQGHLPDGSSVNSCVSCSVTVAHRTRFGQATGEDRLPTRLIAPLSVMQPGPCTPSGDAFSENTWLRSKMFLGLRWRPWTSLGILENTATAWIWRSGTWSERGPQWYAVWWMWNRTLPTSLALISSGVCLLTCFFLKSLFFLQNVQGQEVGLTPPCWALSPGPGRLAHCSQSPCDPAKQCLQCTWWWKNWRLCSHEW